MATVVKLPVGFSAPLKGSSLQQVMASGQPRMLNDLQAYLMDHPQSVATRLIVEEGVRSSLTCPLTAMGKRVGVLFFSSFQKDTYRAAHADLFLAIAGHLSTIIEKGRIYEMVLQSKQESERLLVQLTRLNAGKDRLFAMVAHDLKSPFSGVQGMLELLVENVPGMTKDEIHRDLKLLSASASETFNLMENLLQWSTFETGEMLFRPTVQRVDDTARGVISLVSAAAHRKSIEITVIGNPEAVIVADKSMLHSIIQNLISNAIKFTDVGGSVTVTSRVDDNKWVEVAVSDSGVGMSAEAFSKVMQRESHHSSYGTHGERGTGLGLNLCRTFVEKHGGVFSGSSEPLKGTTFKFTLPLAKSTADSVASAQPPLSLIGKSGHVSTAQFG
jgi:signal transduction histidine kinase